MLFFTSSSDHHIQELFKDIDFRHWTHVSLSVCILQFIIIWLQHIKIRLLVYPIYRCRDSTGNSNLTSLKKIARTYSMHNIMPIDDLATTECSMQYIISHGIDLVLFECEITPRWMLQKPTNEKSTLVQVMAWCRQAASHYLNQCRLRSPTPYGATRPQWVDIKQCVFTYDYRRQLTGSRGGLLVSSYLYKRQTCPIMILCNLALNCI